jgi:hypothetical protein
VVQVRTNVAGWFTVVVLAYYYKLVVFGFGAEVLGFSWLSTTGWAGIDLNHWIETLIYCPLVWFALHQINADVFGDPPLDPDARRRHRRRQSVGDVCNALFLYGTGIHIANVIELASRDETGASDHEVYDLVYFLDEGLSHYVQFIPLFAVLGWTVLHDRPGRLDCVGIGIFLGVAHGVERGVGIIEGGKWFLGAPAVAWLAVAVLARVHARGREAFSEFFVRYAVAFCITLPVAEVGYRLQVGSFAQPSSLGTRGAVGVIAAGVATTLLGTALALGAEHRLTRSSGQRSSEVTWAAPITGQSVTRPASSRSFVQSMVRRLHQA